MYFFFKKIKTYYKQITIYFTFENWYFFEKWHLSTEPMSQVAQIDFNMSNLTRFCEWIFCELNLLTKFVSQKFNKRSMAGTKPSQGRQKGKAKERPKDDQPKFVFLIKWEWIMRKYMICYIWFIMGNEKIFDLLWEMRKCMIFLI
jgi:hypothetical protein